MSATRILVTGAGGSAGINFIESLRMSGDPFYIAGADINRWHLELPKVDIRYIVPKANDPAYVPTLNKIVRKEGIEFVHAQPDIEVEVISEHREKIEAKTFLPAKETIRICRDKMATNLRLREAGVPAPLSYLVELTSDIPRLLEKLRGSSGIVWIRAIRGAGSRAALPVRTVRQAREWIHYWRTMRALESKDFMLSEYLPGEEYAFQSVWHDGEVVTSAARTRIEYLFGNLSVSGQSSTPSVAKTVHNDAVNRVATRGIQAVDPWPNGVFCVDLKENQDGVPCVTEINAGRFFTTSNFFATLGANMPADVVRLALGGDVSDRPKYNAVPPDCYWIRLVDGGPVLVRGEEWRGMTV